MQKRKKTMVALKHRNKKGAHNKWNKKNRLNTEVETNARRGILATGPAWNICTYINI